MGFYVRKGFNFGPLRVNFPGRASDCRWASKGCVLVPDRTEILFMPAERAFIISRRFLKSAKAKICCVWAGLCWRFWRLWLPVFIFICKPAVILAWWKVCYGSNWQIGRNGKNSRHSIAGTCLKIAIDILGLLTAAVIIFFLCSPWFLVKFISKFIDWWFWRQRRRIYRIILFSSLWAFGAPL